MLFSRNFRLLSIFALMVAAPQVLCAAEPVGDSTITSKRYVDNKIPADSTAHLLVTPQASGGNATKRAITTAGTGITGLESASSSGATNIPTAYAVKEAIGTATSGMITDVSGKQDKDNNEVYKVGYNGGWANANTAVAVDTTYLDKTNNDNGSVTVKVDTTKLASAKTDITDLTSSSTDANKGKLTTAYAVKQSLDDKQQKITHSSTNKVVITPTTDGGATGTRDITTAGTNITNLASPSATGATNIPTAYAVKEAIGEADISWHLMNGAPLSNTASYFYGTSGTAAATAAKTVLIPSITVAPTTGMTIVVMPRETSNAANPTLNLNSTGAKAIKYNGLPSITAEISGQIWTAGVPSVFVYNGSNWVFAGHGVDNDTTYSVFTGATANAAGTSGLVKAPAAGDQAKYLRGDGTWAGEFTGATSSAAGTAGLVKKPAAGDQAKYLRGDGTWAGEFTGANGTIAGTAGLVKAPAATDNTKFLKGDGTWGTPTDTNTTYTADEETISKDTSNKFSAMTAAVAQNGKALTTGGQVYTYAQPKTTGTIYKIGYNGTWSNLGTTLDPNATGYVADNAVTAATIANAISSAVSGADISAHTVNGAPLSNTASYYYGSGVGTAGTAAKTVTISSITTAPTAGMTIVVNPAETASTETSLTLNLNNTGAKTVKYNGSTTLTAPQSKAIWKKDVPVVFVYDGTNWLYSGKEYTAGTGISISDANVITNTGVRAVTASGTGAADGTISVNTDGSSANVAVKGWDNKQTKPSSVSNGKVLTYTGTNANSSVSAKYIQVPVATGDPNDGGTLNSTNPLASIWVE